NRARYRRPDRRGLRFHARQKSCSRRGRGRRTNRGNCWRRCECGSHRLRSDQREAREPPDRLRKNLAGDATRRQIHFEGRKESSSSLLNSASEVPAESRTPTKKRGNQGSPTRAILVSRPELRSATRSTIPHTAH